MHIPHSGHCALEQTGATDALFLIDELQSAEHYFRVVARQHLLMRQLREAQMVESHQAKSQPVFADDDADFDGGDVRIED